VSQRPFPARRHRRGASRAHPVWWVGCSCFWAARLRSGAYGSPSHTIAYVGPVASSLSSFDGYTGLCSGLMRGNIHQFIADPPSSFWPPACSLRHRHSRRPPPFPPQAASALQHPWWVLSAHLLGGQPLLPGASPHNCRQLFGTAWGSTIRRTTPSPGCLPDSLQSASSSLTATPSSSASSSQTGSSSLTKTPSVVRVVTKLLTAGTVRRLTLFSQHSCMELLIVSERRRLLSTSAMQRPSLSTLII